MNSFRIVIHSEVHWKSNKKSIYYLLAVSLKLRSIDMALQMRRMRINILLMTIVLKHNLLPNHKGTQYNLINKHYISKIQAVNKINNICFVLKRQ